MKESYIEGLAPHDGPESCVGTREDAGEALTGGSAGRVLSREINHFRMPTLLTEAEGHMSTGAKASPGAVLRGRRPLACTDTPCARTGRSSARPPKLGGTHREGRGRTPMTNGQRKSDRLVVPTKPPNKAGGTRLRRWWREGAWPRRRWESKTRPRHRAGQCVSSALPRLRQAAVRFDVIIRGKSPVREQRSLGSVRGAVRADKAKGRPYRDPDEAGNDRGGKGPWFRVLRKEQTQREIGVSAQRQLLFPLGDNYTSPSG